jgi:hypothetical protein
MAEGGNPNDYPDDSPRGESSDVSRDKLRQASDGHWQELRADGYWYPVEGPSSTPGPSVSAQTTRSSVSTTNSTVPAGAWMAIIGGALMSVGALLPWITASSPFGQSFSRNGFQLGNGDAFSIDGVIAVIMGVVTIIIGIIRLTNSRSPRYLQRSAIVTGVVALAICLNRYSSLNDLANNVRSVSKGVDSTSISYGFWILGVGGVLAIAAGFILRSQSSQVES